MAPDPQTGPQSPVTALETVLKAIQDVFHVHAVQLLGDSRPESIAFARQVAMLALREQFGLTVIEVGRLLKRDHTTVCWARNALERRLRKKPALTRHALTHFLQRLNHHRSQSP